MTRDPEPGEPLQGLLLRVVGELEAAKVPDEALATMKHPRLRAPRLVRAGRAWRLGVLLLDRDARLYSTGSVTRAVLPLRGVANKSPDADERREYRRMAVRGRFAEGETVNFDHAVIALDPESLASGCGLVLEREGIVVVRWNQADPVAGVRPLSDYLAERLSLATRGGPEAGDRGAGGPEAGQRS